MNQQRSMNSIINSSNVETISLLCSYESDAGNPIGISGSCGYITVDNNPVIMVSLLMRVDMLQV